MKRNGLCYFLLFIYQILIPIIIYAQDDQFRFERISIQEGLSQSTVNCFLMDKKGFLWIGTGVGLNRYDGYSIKTYMPDPDCKNCISNGYVLALYEDSTASGDFLWIATVGGLDRLNLETEEFIHYHYRDNDPNCLSNDFVFTLCPDDSNNLWIGTSAGGISILNLKTDKFSYLRHDPENINSLSSDIVYQIIRDKFGLFWIGTENGLDCYDPVKKIFIHYRHDKTNPNSPSDNKVMSLCMDKDYHLWIGTVEGGLNRLDLSDYKSKKELFKSHAANFKCYRSDPHDSKSIGANMIYSIQQDGKGRIWVGSYGGGLSCYNPITDDFINFKQNPDDPSSLGNNDLKSVYIDQKEMALWVGTNGGGVFKHAFQQKQFWHLGHNPDNPNSLGYNTILGITEDNSGYVWICTQSHGLNRYDPNTNKFKYYRSDFLNPNSLPNDNLIVITTDSQGDLWLGTLYGLIRFDQQREMFYRYLLQPTSLSQEIKGIYKETSPSTDWIWIGTYSGLHKVYLSTNKIERFQHDSNNSNTLVNNSVNMIYGEYVNKELILWIATEGGLDKYHIRSNTFTHFVHDSTNNNSISSNSVQCIFRDALKRMWIGTYGGGLNLLDEHTGLFKNYSEKNGLASNSVVGILDDTHGKIWISTIKGISKFDPNIERFRNYDASDGLRCSEFWNWAFLKSHSGRMYFGGNNGIVYFYPDSIKENLNIPTIVLTDFKVFNQSIIPGEKSPLRKTISTANEIILPYEQDIFTVEFSAVDYTAPMKNQYAYKLSGVNVDWVHTDATRRYATYTKLDPGEYTFQVKGSNNDGIWNERGTSIKIIILPPWYRSKIAYTFYFLALIGLIAGTWRWQINRLKSKHQQEMEHLEAEKIKEIDQAKSRFFANISHEFRTPLTLIEGPIKQLLGGELMSDAKEHYRMILRNTKRLLDLVNQLLDLSKLESGRMKLQAKKQDIVTLLQGLVQSFESMAKRKNIEFIFQFKLDNVQAQRAIPQPMAYIDEEKLERIVNNLLSNAFKFTPDGGRVKVVVNITENQSKHPPQSPLNRGKSGSSPLEKWDQGGCVEISITNTGPGIPADKISHIFDRFYQVDDTQTRHYEGTGIGLALVKEMVELHHGQITAASEPGKETSFTVTIPTDLESYAESEIFRDEKLEPEVIYTDGGGATEKTVVDRDIAGVFYELPLQIRESIPLKRTTKTSPVVLIIDDNADVRKYIGGLLKSNYKIIETEKGDQGLMMAKKKIPELIISDVMMPGMDGYELCKRIKTDIEISHIPVILLTARAANEDKLAGLELGADDYIIKPFEARELQLRVHNLLKLRQRLKEKFTQGLDISPKEITVTSVDRQFITRLIDTVEKEIKNPNFCVQRLIQEIGMSKSNLNRKLNTLLGTSPVNFIRLIRLKRAKKLLEGNFGNVTQVAYEVGFNNVSYFSKCYRSLFGTIPSQRIK